MTARDAREQAGRELRSARLRLNEVLQTAQQLAREGAADGVPETVIAEGLGVTRATVRKWIGK